MQHCTRLMLDNIETVPIGGLPLARLDREQTAQLMISLAQRKDGGAPVIMSSANGEVISRCAASPDHRQLFECADLLSADGQPMVLLSRWLTSRSLPERVATTDLFHDVARRACEAGASFYMLGASPTNNALAVARVRERYPALRLLGHSHGFLSDDGLRARVAEINALAPDILWVSLGVPREQQFCIRYREELARVGVIKTSGGLFDFLCGAKQRAPQWMQDAGLEWLFRLGLEPRRLFWRYAITNPHALFVMLTRSA